MTNKAELLDKLIAEIEQQTRSQAMLILYGKADLIVYDVLLSEISLVTLIAESKIKVEKIKSQLLDEFDAEQEEEDSYTNLMRLHEEADTEDITLGIY